MVARMRPPAMLLRLGDQPMDGTVGRFDERALPDATSDALRRPSRDLVDCLHAAIPIPVSAVRDAILPRSLRAGHDRQGAAAAPSPKV